MRSLAICLSLFLFAACSEAAAPKDKPASKPEATQAAPAATAQTAPAPVVPAPAPAPAQPAVDTARKTFVDFSIPLVPYKPADLRFNNFANRWLMIFYFSPTCGHCQHTYPEMRKMRKQYEARGLSFIAVASGYSQPEDLMMFDQDLKLDMPTFRDADMGFAKAYGTGSVPLMLLVSPKGSFQLWNRSDETTLKEIDATIRKSLGIK